MAKIATHKDFNDYSSYNMDLSGNRNKCVVKNSGNTYTYYVPRDSSVPRTQCVTERWFDEDPFIYFKIPFSTNISVAYSTQAGMYPPALQTGISIYGSVNLVDYLKLYIYQGSVVLSTDKLTQIDPSYGFNGNISRVNLVDDTEEIIIKTGITTRSDYYSIEIDPGANNSIFNFYEGGYRTKDLKIYAGAPATFRKDSSGYYVPDREFVIKFTLND